MLQVEADIVGKGAVEQWQTEKIKNQKKRGRPRLSGSTVGQSKITRPIRTLPDSSSQTNSQQEETEAGTGPESNVAVSNQEPASPEPAPSSIEIAETQQEVSDPATISVNIPHADFDRNDYESLHSSQLHGLFSPEQSQRPSAQRLLSTELAQISS